MRYKATIAALCLLAGSTSCTAVSRRRDLCSEAPGCDTAAATRCTDDGRAIEVCAVDPQGCLFWADLEPCAATESCELEGGEATCVEVEPPTCDRGEERCVGTRQQYCDGTGWTTLTDCAALGFECVEEDGGASCQGTCVDGCADPDGSRCEGQVVLLCVVEPTGCLGWEPLTDCERTGQRCAEEGGEAWCEGSCTDACPAEGRMGCDGSLLERCDRIDGESCLRWVALRDCAGLGFLCEETTGGAECVPPCLDECDPTVRHRCFADQLQACVVGETGCTTWSLVEDCADSGLTCFDSPEGALCSCPEGCPPGATACEGDLLVSCGPTPDDECPSWQLVTDCSAWDHGVCAETFFGAECQYTSDPEVECADGLDNDGDGAVDCRDSDCYGTPGCGSTLGIWESFEAPGDSPDLSGHSLLFTPSDVELQGYSWSVADVADYPDAPGSGDATLALTLSDDDNRRYDLTLFTSFTFYGIEYRSVFVNSNGSISFGLGDNSFNVDDPERHFALPRVAALATDLDPGAGGQVIVDEFADRLVVTYDEIRPWGSTSGAGPNDVQVTLRSGGEVEVHLVRTTATHFLTGIGNGMGGSIPPETDFVP